MFGVDMDKPERCSECPIYNYKGDSCNLTGENCRLLWMNYSEEELQQWQNRICPLIDEDDLMDRALFLAKIKNATQGETE